MEPQTRFSELIRRRRWRRRLSLEKLAGLVDVNPSYISRIENGLRIPKNPTIIRMATALGFDPDYLLMVAGRAPDFLLDFLASRPPDDVRRLFGAMARRRYSSDDWAELVRLALELGEPDDTFDNR